MFRYNTISSNFWKKLQNANAVPQDLNANDYNACNFW